MQRIIRYAFVTVGSWAVTRVVDRVLDRRGTRGRRRGRK
jgi:hypothetical protein